MTFAASFAKLNALNMDVMFEVRFNAMQNMLLKRANDEIAKVQQADKTGDVLAQLDKRRKSLTEELPLIQQYVFSASGNIDRLESANVPVTSALSYFVADGTDKTALTAEEADAVNESIAESLEYVDQVALLSHPKISGTHTILRLRDLANEIRGMSAVEGAVATEDDEAPVNDNRALLTLLREFSTTVNVAYAGSVDSRDQATELSLSLQTKLMEIESSAAEATEIGATKVVEEVDAIKLKYANVLKAVSISFEASKQIFAYLDGGLSPQRPQPGSVLNMFS